MPALDTCGGHIDPGGWDHWHATATDIDSLYAHDHIDLYAHDHIDADCGLDQSASAQFGYAFDGSAMFVSADADGAVPTDLDACNGHIGPTPTHPAGEYHYHATTDFPNLPACLTGVQAEVNFRTTAPTGIGSGNSGGGGPGQGRMPPRLEHSRHSTGCCATGADAGRE
jgi:hypothetical protein